MNNNIIRRQLKSVISETRLKKLGRELGFTQRERDVNGFNMVNALIESAGDAKIESLADIGRQFNALTDNSLAAKPFHNQLKKDSLEKLMHQLTGQALNKWCNQYYQLPEHYQQYFKSIYLHDGSTLSLHPELQDIFPGRFTKTSPAAIELHVTMDLLNQSIETVTIDADKESERQFLPQATTLSQSLLLTDAGYFEHDYLNQIDDNDGYFACRAGVNINPKVLSGIRCDGQAIKIKKASRLKTIRGKLPTDQSFELSVQWNEKIYRLIGFFNHDKKKFSFIVTNLPSAQFDQIEIGKLYRLRWQIELLFKEWKSHNNLKKFNTKNSTIIYTLIWASLLAITLKRLLAGYVEQQHNVLLSPLTVAKTIQGWWYELFRAIMDKSQRRILTMLDKCSTILSNNAKVANINRDIKTGKFQFMILPVNCKIEGLN